MLIPKHRIFVHK